MLFFAQCPYDKVLGASNLSMLRYEWIWYKERGTGFLNANRAPLKKSENILVAVALPAFLLAMYEKTGSPLKRWCGTSCGPVSCGLG